MSAAVDSIVDSSNTNASTMSKLPIVIVGNGPVGMRTAKEIIDKTPNASIIIYGEEQQEAYNRVKLSSWLAGDVDWNSLLQPLETPSTSNIQQRFGFKVTRIDAEKKCIYDNSNKEQPYSKLVLATGSYPYEPSIPGVHQHGVYTFRNFVDATNLIARRARSHHTVVIGGGLLGIESARAMQKQNTKVTLIEHTNRLLSNQLDEAAATILQDEILSLGINLITNDSVKEIFGDREERVYGLSLRSGQQIACDTIILSTGIRPNIELAQQTKLKYKRGVIVNDSMQTSEPDIYAVGECAEHQDKIYGLVAPGLEQASVAAAHIANIKNSYAGSVAASRLKVIGTQVFSMGPMGNDEIQHYGRHYIYKDLANGIYRKILVHRYRLVGAIGIGQWDETVRLQTTIGNAATIFPWQVMRFLRTGNIWPDDVGSTVTQWPANAVVCQCMNVSRGTISECIKQNHSCSVEVVSETTGASTVCGSCKPLVQELIGTDAEKQAVPMYKSLFGISIASLFIALLFYLAPNIPYATTVQNDWHWDVLWRTELFKQISGFTVLGLFSAGLFLSLRKRIRKFDKMGKFDYWRFAHISLGLLVVITLVVHTGFRLGHGLNNYLMLTFSLMLIVGAFSSGVISLEHKLSNSITTRLRRLSVFGHIILFWPIPVLLAWHILKGYWY